MKVLQVLSSWNKPGSKYVQLADGTWRRERTESRKMAMCQVRLESGEVVTRHLPQGDAK